MKLKRPKIASDINSDLAIGVIARNMSSVAGEMIPLQTVMEFNGTHERTAKGDELTLTVTSTSKKASIRYQLKRDSLYHILPEYLFHPLDRYANSDGDKEMFLKARAEQKKVENEAKEYFYPYDKILNGLRVSFQNKLNDAILGNDSFIVDFITKNDDFNRGNRFIQLCLPYVIKLRAHRGSKDLLRAAIDAAFGINLYSMEIRFKEFPLDIDSQTCHISLDGCLDDLFCGNTYCDWQEIIHIQYQTKLETSEDIVEITKSLNEFSLFFKRWFLSDNQYIEIEFGDFLKLPIISDDSSVGSLFLNYNTQLIAS